MQVITFKSYLFYCFNLILIITSLDVLITGTSLVSLNGWSVPAAKDSLVRSIPGRSVNRMADKKKTIKNKIMNIFH